MLVNAQTLMKSLLQLYLIDSNDDMELIVASDKDSKISPIRQAFQTVFGKATVR